MAIGFILEFPGSTKEQYDAVMAELDLQGVLPPGAISHFAGMNDNGVVVVDLWESPEAFDSFFNGRVGQALRNAGVQPPNATAIQVHNFMK